MTTEDFWTVVLAVAIPISGQIGVMIWWMSSTNTKVKGLTEEQKTFKTTLETHVQEDKLMGEKIQALEVNEANVGGELSNLALKIEQLQRDTAMRQIGDGKLLQLKLDNQSSELLLKFRDMLHVARKEWTDELHAARKEWAEELNRVLNEHKDRGGR